MPAHHIALDWLVIMQTGGYDVVAQISDELINKALSIAYYLDKFPSLKGKYPLPIDGVPESLKSFTEIGYEINLADPPVYTPQADGKAGITFNGQAKVAFLGGLQVGSGAEIKIVLTPAFDQTKHTLGINFAGSVITSLTLKGFTDVPAATIELLKGILTVATVVYLSENVGTIDVTPSLLSAEEKLNLNVAHVGISPPIFNVAGNVLNRQGGSANQIQNFCQDSHISVGITADAIHRIYNQWWDQTPSPKVVTKTVSKTFDFDFLPDWVDSIDKWTSTVLTGGLISEDVDVKGIKVSLTATLVFSKFNFDFKANNQIQVSGSLILTLSGGVDLLIKTTTTALLVFKSENNGSIPLFPAELPPTPILITSATAELDISPRNRLVVKITDLKAEIPLVIPLAPDPVTQYIKDQITSSIAEFVGSIDVSPTVIEEKIPGTDLTIQAKVNRFSSNTKEAIVGIRTKTLGVGSYAPYICNKDSGHMEVHKKDCKWTKKILPKHLAYYCDLKEALEDGFDGCYYCLNDYHTR